jgi:hypothetical protein
MDLSGFGWNDDLKIIEASAEVWDRFLDVCILKNTIIK